MACFPCWGRSSHEVKGDTDTLPQIQVQATTASDASIALAKADNQGTDPKAASDGCPEASSLLPAQSLSHADSHIKQAPITVKPPSDATPIELLRDIAALQFVGQGASGDVFRGVWQGAVVAVKYVVIQSSDSPNAANEASLSRMLAHPNVVQTFSCKTVTLSHEFFSQLSDLTEVCQGQERAGMDFPYDDFQLSDVGPRSSQNPTEVVLPELARGLSGQRTASVTAAVQPRSEAAVAHQLLSAVQQTTDRQQQQNTQQSTDGDQSTFATITSDVTHSQLHSGSQPPVATIISGSPSDYIQRQGQPESSGTVMSVIDSVRRTASVYNPTTIQGSPPPTIYVNLSGQAEHDTTDIMPIQDGLQQATSRMIRQPHRIVLSDDASVQHSNKTRSADKDQQLFNSHLDAAVIGHVVGMSDLPGIENQVEVFPPAGSHTDTLQANTHQPALLEALQQLQPPSQQERQTTETAQPQPQQQQLPWHSLDSVDDVIPADTLLALQDVLVRSNARLGYQLTQIVMEYCDKGSLQHAITRGLFLPSSKWGARLALRALLRTAQEIAQGMWHIHEASVIHGDLKPGNVLLKGSRWDRRGFVAKVSDFGLSRQSEHTAKDSQHWATVAYMAPETFEGLLARQSDVYSYGITLWQMVTGEKPWDGLHPGQVMVGVQTDSLKLQWPDWVHYRLVRLGSSCLEYDRKKRPSFNAITKELAQIENQIRLESSNGSVSPLLVPSRMGSGSTAGNTASFGNNNNQDQRGANQSLIMRPAMLHNPANGLITPASQPSTAVVYVHDGSSLGNIGTAAPFRLGLQDPPAMVTASVTGHLTPLMSRTPWPASGQDPHSHFSNIPIGPLQIPYSGS